MTARAFAALIRSRAAISPDLLRDAGTPIESIAEQAGGGGA